ncbi:Heterogeneous nuclear ribonucleoproteins C1/C2 [Liparis tanakae]|uniref:Heterogeneous nuclear ribonucleoproteins C1/C2 n=1 Tax=Liparis tanakae TaxID=230148 RepID=A0A4Z2IA97_9TELE|nr:Heterogeneous nuclear ribonucleoproteins C1/C2 [Liparis tanakae]
MCDRPSKKTHGVFLTNTLLTTSLVSFSTRRSEFDLDYDSYHEDYNDRVYDYQRVPASLSPLPLGPSLAKRSRSSSYSSGNRRSRDRTHSKSSRAHSTNSSTAKLGLEELQVIKKELTLIKTQIDGLLDSLDKMDTQRSDHKGSPLREDSPAGSLYALSASSPEHSLSSLSPPSSRHRIHREKPDPREPNDDHHTVNAPEVYEQPQLRPRGGNMRKEHEKT